MAAGTAGVTMSVASIETASMSTGLGHLRFRLERLVGAEGLGDAEPGGLGSEVEDDVGFRLRLGRRGLGEHRLGGQTASGSVDSGAPTASGASGSTGAAGSAGAGAIERAFRRAMGSKASRSSTCPLVAAVIDAGAAPASGGVGVDAGAAPFVGTVNGVAPFAPIVSANDGACRLSGAHVRQRPSASFQQFGQVYCRHCMQKLKV